LVKAIKCGTVENWGVEPHRKNPQNGGGGKIPRQHVIKKEDENRNLTEGKEAQGQIVWRSSQRKETVTKRSSQRKPKRVHREVRVVGPILKEAVMKSPLQGK